MAIIRVSACVSVRHHCVRPSATLFTRQGTSPSRWRCRPCRTPPDARGQSPPCRLGHAHHTRVAVLLRTSRCRVGHEFKEANERQTRHESHRENEYRGSIHPLDKTTHKPCLASTCHCSSKTRKSNSDGNQLNKHPPRRVSAST